MVVAVQSAACCLADWVDASLSSNFQETLPDDRMRHQAELHPAQGHKSPLCQTKQDVRKMWPLLCNKQRAKHLHMNP